LEPLPVERIALNDAANRPRLKELARIEPRPSHVKRLGHAVINTPDVLKSVAWARRHLGLVSSDDVHAEDDPDKTIASFNRADRGAEYVDHHALMYALHARVGLNHLGFEADGLEDVLAGQDYLLRQAKYRHVWGIGRHFLGSQIFDYWKDPYGRQCEHWTDSDLLNHEHQWGRFPRKIGLHSQWGAPSPDEFRESSS
jgi:catechol 2,3-dioxygenase-like lactoylglutathione lyase family enzyme